MPILKGITDRLLLLGLLIVSFHLHNADAYAIAANDNSSKRRISINDGWRFLHLANDTDGIAYDNRPDNNSTNPELLKEYILPLANDFIKDPSDYHQRPSGNPSEDLEFVKNDLDDQSWDQVTLPHDWAIKGPFYVGDSTPVGGGMGRLPIQGIAWYRRKISYTSDDEGKSIYLDIDGAMSYSMVWINGKLAGGWPYGYNSYRVDLTPHLQSGDDNQLAIRLDNPVDSSRWYPGGGIYRNVWLTKVDSVHVAQSGTYVTAKNITSQSAKIELEVSVQNKAEKDQDVEVVTDIHVFDAESQAVGEKVATVPSKKVKVSAGKVQVVEGAASVENPQLWGPLPTQKPNLYVAVTRIKISDKTVDTYETPFGIRTVVYDSDNGLIVNGEHIRIQGVNQHSDLGALGMAFNVRAAERQLEILREMGTNAIRMSHNPPAPELLELTDRLGFIVMDEIFDCWERQKTENDFHLIFKEWHEPDLRSFLRRDRNHPSIVAWSIGNEVGEQTTGEAGAAIAKTLRDIVHEEDPTRPVTASMNAARPEMPFPAVLDLISLNYQGEGLRDTPPYQDLPGDRVPPQHPLFHKKFPDKLLLATESSASLSTRGTFLFPVTNETSAPTKDTPGGGGDPDNGYVSAYDLYSSNFGASPDKVFAKQDEFPYVAGEFVWSGWDYLGEPTPYYDARSSYFGIIDLAGFKKDRFYLYQARWRDNLQFAHILPHWNWPDRVGEVTPVHVYSSADEAELFLNGKSQGRVEKGASNYRFRWDEVVYQPGELRVQTWKNGKKWAEATVKTTGAANGLKIAADRKTITSDGYDLSFLSVDVVDKKGDVVAQANNTITFSVAGPGEIVATDNGDPNDMTAFPSKERKAFSGKALVIVRATPGASGTITVTASSSGLKGATVKVTAR